ncbi:hypothetical protein PVAG01_09584 [Phlyctema vagabunda]|uniref:Uncharacterized protein n=1 Tax=Phlyctema vagabunda TaxID=108571 RepID=A0ABR4P869_9HELO
MLIFTFQMLSMSWTSVSRHVSGTRTKSARSEGVAVLRGGASDYDRKAYGHRATFQPGVVKPVGSLYTKMLVIAKTKAEDTSWVDENFHNNPQIQHSIYVADDPTAALHPPRNKGNEAMIYLTYIIDNYNNLSDVNIFMHSHRFAWHNNIILDKDAVQMINRLSAERVQREGYMNMRCHWDPGCPKWIYPSNLDPDGTKQEEPIIAVAWSEIFPLDPLPEVLAQPCCAQFAVSRDRILSVPLERYIVYRDWLLRTPFSDYVSGRVFEYIWQFMFTGKAIVCAAENVCYCDGYGVCFGNSKNYREYMVLDGWKKGIQKELESQEQYAKTYEILVAQGKHDRAAYFGKPSEEKMTELKETILGATSWSEDAKKHAMYNGDVAESRAAEAGRPWKEGDGF